MHEMNHVLFWRIPTKQRYASFLMKVFIKSFQDLSQSLYITNIQNLKWLLNNNIPIF